MFLLSEVICFTVILTRVVLSSVCKVICAVVNCDHVKWNSTNWSCSCHGDRIGGWRDQKCQAVLDIFIDDL